MNRAAKVTSIDAIRSFKLAVQGFEDDVRDALTNLMLEVRRAVDWFEQDRKRYWPDQVRRRWEEVNQARINLERCRLQKYGDKTPACYEEKEALEKAKRRLRVAQNKVEAVRRWSRTVKHEADEFQGRMGQMNWCLDSDVPQVVAALERILTALEKYASVAGGVPAEGGDTLPIMDETELSELGLPPEDPAASAGNDQP